MDGIFIKECTLENIYHYNALSYWKRMDIGDKLYFTLKGMPITWDTKNSKNMSIDRPIINWNISNNSDLHKEKVLLLFLVDKSNKENFPPIGELNEEDSKLLIDFVRQGWGESLYAILSSKDERQDENKRIKVAIYIAKKKAVQTK